MRRLRWCGLPGVALLVLAIALAPGCGGDPDAIPAVPAAGTVTYQGKPLPEGNIVFQPIMEAKGRPASGTIKDGKFSLSTYGTDDGAIPGKHKVAVMATKEVPSKEGDTATQYLIPEKYASPETSGIEIEIPPGGKKDIAIDIPG
ncbi:MAG: hypothetical protein IRY99_12255 [Isosphaeraceae bacterium]|nr:hypothetical protein [Isosphaeraceae bacterium]